MFPRSIAQAVLSAQLAGLMAALALVAATSLPAHAETFDEGIDYRLVERPARAEGGEAVEVVELFWYGCPHCYQLEPHIDRWLQGQSAAVSFRRMPAVASPRWVPHAKAYYAAEMLGELDRLHEPLFKALHDEKRRIQTEDQIIAFAAEQGIDEEAFRKAYNSFPVDMQVRKSGDLGRRYGIDGVPAMVVNGKYVTSASQTGSTGRMFQVIDDLVAREVSAAAAEPADVGAPAAGRRG